MYKYLGTTHIFSHTQSSTPRSSFFHSSRAVELLEIRDREMTIGEVKDVANGEVNGLEDLEEPFIRQDNTVSYEYDESKDHKSVQSGSIGIVLLSTFVAVCGSFEFGSCVSVLFSLIMIFLVCKTRQRLIWVY